MEDVTAIDQDADSLLAELEAGELGEPGAGADLGGSETHRPPTPQTASEESPANIHTIPHERSHSAATPPTDATQEDPPSSFEK